MIWLVLALFFSVYIYLSVKYQNPYRLTFIFGKKGAGKSCFMVRKMLYYRKKGWNVYTDMADIKIPGVHVIDIHHLEHFRPLPNSAVFLDEVGISMDNRSFKSFPPGLRDFFKYSRKMKLVIYMNSQAYDVDKKVRDTTDSMLLMQSIGSFLCICRPIIRSITLTAPSADSESRIADVLRFAPIWRWRVYYMPSYFGYFDSSAMPTRLVVEGEEPVGADERYSHTPLRIFFGDVIEFVRTRPSALLGRIYKNRS